MSHHAHEPCPCTKCQCSCLVENAKFESGRCAHCMFTCYYGTVGFLKADGTISMIAPPPGSICQTPSLDDVLDLAEQKLAVMAAERILEE